MFNKQTIWSTFLCSIILILSIIYVSTNQDDSIQFQMQDLPVSEFVIQDNTELVALRIESEEEELNVIQDLQNIILDENSTIEMKNEAYDTLISLKDTKSMEEKIIKLLKEEYGYESFVKVNGDNITIVIKSDKHDYTLANTIIRKVNSYFKDKYVTVKFS